MAFFTFLRGGRSRRCVTGVVAFLLISLSLLRAQPETNSSSLPGPGEISQESNMAATNAPATNAHADQTNAPAEPETAPVAPATSAPAQPMRTGSTTEYVSQVSFTVVSPAFLCGLMTLASLGGFLLYYCGLTRAKNSGHTSTLLLVGVLFGLTGYWIGGFAVQTGGIGDAHAALAQSVQPAEKSALDHELGPVVAGHHWGVMGSAGFFLETDDPNRNAIAELFLTQAALLAIALAAVLGAALERARLVSMAVCAFLFGVLIYPLLGNWVWGGGWLAELGREFGLGHGVVDLAGAGVVHETAGTLALVIAVVLGPRHGRFGRTNSSNAIPGHNVPFMVLGSIVLLISWMAANAFASDSLKADPTATDAASSVTSAAGLAAVNTLLAAAGGLMATFIQGSWQKRKPEPARLCRGLLGGAVASCGGAGLIDPWAAFVIGVVAALLVQVVVNALERRRIDDPVGAVAVHGAGGAWGVVAVGLFANGAAGDGLNGVASSVRGLFFGGAWHQLAAQVLGCVTGFVVIYILGLACVNLVQKIVGNRTQLAHETGGLDWPEVGAHGYQGDVDPDDSGGRD